jgi:hypothetical protein
LLSGWQKKKRKEVVRRPWDNGCGTAASRHENL